MAPKRAPPRNYTRFNKDNTYWEGLIRYSAYKPTPFVSSNSERLNRRRVKREKERIAFKSKFRFKQKRAGRPSNLTDTVKCLTHWVTYLSWGYCKSCGLLEKKPLAPKSFNSKGASHITACLCTKQKYVVPTFSAIPVVLTSLSKDEEAVLRLFDIDIGPTKVARAGHRIKNGAFELRYRADTVEERIAGTSDKQSRLRLQAAYDYLANSSSSAYQQYLAHQAPPSPDTTKIKFWKVYKDMPAIESALWPVLYPFTSWCESILDGSTSRDSTLVSFRCKLLSNIIDYNNNFRLLQFQYDRWIFKTITGAVAIGHRMKTSPRRALETKSFTSEYWRWQHRFLQDAVLQFGNPSIFLTISPYEWDFPKPKWVERAMLEHDIIPTACGAIETIHIAHTLEQMCKGYVSGCNTGEWDTHNDHHVFYNKKDKQPCNVRCVFFRFEYQQRRTIHIHMVVWLKNIANINLNLLSATIPEDDEDLGFLVHRIQPSDTPAPFLAVHDGPNEVSEDGQLTLKHTEFDESLNLRAYIPAVIATLNSRMDVQASDGNSALMQYVTSYATKLHDSHDALRSTETSPFQVAVPFLLEEHPGEPEMAMAFSNTHMSYCNLSRYKLVPPVREEFFKKSAIFKKYMDRPSSADNLTCLQYCQQFVISKAIPTTSSADNLVGVKYKYIFSKDFFFQYTIVNTPFRNLGEIQHPSYASVRDDLKPFSYMIHNHHDFLLDSKAVTDFLKILSYKDHKITQFISFKDGLAYLFYKTLNDSACPLPPPSNEILLTDEQKMVYNHVIQKLKERARVAMELQSEELSEYSDSDSDADCRDISHVFLSDSEGSSGPSRDTQGSSAPSRDIPINITLDVPDEGETSDPTYCRPTLLSGRPGTGKTAVSRKIVDYCIEKGLCVLFACPTAHQARHILSQFQDDEKIKADTIHSLFKIPVNSSEGCDINWSLLKYDIIIIDEVAMVEVSIIEHVFKTCYILPTSPVLLFAGDPLQQQALTTSANRTTTGHSIFSSPSLLAKCDSFSLYKGLRSDCGILDSLLTDIRGHYPSHKHLDFLNDVSFAKDGEEVSEEVVKRAFTTCPNSTFLTISRKGSYYINDIIVSILFSTDTPLLKDAPIADDLKSNLYDGMRIIITKNICKTLGIVNGECGVITDLRKNNLIVKLCNGALVSVHQITDEEDTPPYYPLLPNYAMTIFKVQGKTIPNVIIWLNNDIRSPGAAYVALSRVKCHTGIRLLEQVSRLQVCPISRSSLQIEEES